MASLGRSTLLPQCTSCLRRVTQLTWGSLQQVRGKSKAAREAERNIVVKLLQDVPRFGRAGGSYIPLNPATMRNRWFPSRLADYVPAVQSKKLRAEGVEITRDTTFGVRDRLEEVEDEEDDFFQQPKHYVRPIEIDLLSPERSMELLNTFVPPTIDFARQPIEQDKADGRPRYGASDAADILTAATMANQPKPSANGIYGSVSNADIASTIKAALAHNDEAARVLLSDGDISFVTGHEGDDTSRVKQLGMFRVQIQIPGAKEPITRNIRIRAKAEPGA
ncbi:hypothetical protein BDV95DRAFT_493022 [Massariosphaeria phaeospora]|uniref:Ribosomal protein L9 domain-containing protein n=1 Tax=Massariosphaeria phaeospora TaxID=100035 RepID=A0A7C8IA67_9PLEO|nr:hypothetical protein BDV95DRAFT_493022 [Massariosphaeria phaeospora]